MKQQQYLQSPIEWKSGESSQTKEELPMDGPTCLKKQPPRVAFRNNDIYMVNGWRKWPIWGTTRTKCKSAFYKLKVNEDPTSKNMPHEEDFDDNNYESIEEKDTSSVITPHLYDLKIFTYNILMHKHI